MMISTLLFDEETCERFDLEAIGLPRPYRDCVVLGLVCDMEGLKESKSKGNYTSPNLVLRGITKLMALPDASVSPTDVGLKKAQVRSLDIAKNDRVVVSARKGEDGVACRVVAAKVKPKDTVHLNPEVIATLGLPAEGGPIWFKTPGEPAGSDAFRWLFCASNPPWSNTRLSVRNIREGQREFLIRLRNVYQFFAIYANIAAEAGAFDPSGRAPRGPSGRSDLDRWVLHRAAATTASMTESLDAHRIYDAARDVLGLVEDVSNWYVRRSRSRFWGEGADLEDALWTLYEVLGTIVRLIAPFVPFTADGLYRRLVPLAVAGAEASVHALAWPDVDESALLPELASDMKLVRQLASLGLAARSASKVKVRQPLRTVTVVLADPSRRAAVEAMGDVILSELNVRELVFADNAGDYVDFRVKPDFKRLGRKLGRDMKAVASALGQMEGTDVKARLEHGGVEIALGDGRSVTLTSDDVLVSIVPKGEYQAAASSAAVVVLTVAIDDDLRAEGLVRELTNRVQNLRKELDFGYTQRIALRLDGGSVIKDAVTRYGSWIESETLCVDLALGSPAAVGWEQREWDVEGHLVQGWLQSR
jgi:isoleucyl-tRNA synthetase